MRTTQADLSKDLEDLVWLHRHCFPSDEFPEWNKCTWWITREGKKPIAFVGLEPVKSFPQAVYLTRVGVAQTHRGKGIQRFLMGKVFKAARGIYQHLISSTYENPASANNFIRQGYETYAPATPWGAAGTIYWIKDIT